MSVHPALAPTIILTSSLALFVGACGDPAEDDTHDDPGQGIVGVWAGNGDVLVSGFELEDDAPLGATLPEGGMPSLGDPVDGCAFPRGLELFPTPQIALTLDPAQGATDDPPPADYWVTSFEIDDQSFALRFDADVQVPEDPINAGEATYRTGANAYVIDVFHPDPQQQGPFELHFNWQAHTDYLIPEILMDPPLAFETGQVGIELASHGQVFVTDGDDCSPLDDSIFGLEMDQESEEITGSRTLTIDGQRATVVLYARGLVDIDSRPTATDSGEWITAGLDALFEVDVASID